MTSTLTVAARTATATEFTHHAVRWPDGNNPLPPPRTWDYANKYAATVHARAYANDLALCTCSNGHTCRLVSTVHRVADDGTVSPSYVCPVVGCGFHEFVRLVGWTKSIP